MLMTLIVIAATAVVEMMSTSISNLLSMLHLQNQLLPKRMLPKKMLKQPQLKRLDQMLKRMLLLTLALKKHQQKKHQRKKKQKKNSSQILPTKSQRKLSLGIMLSAL